VQLHAERAGGRVRNAAADDVATHDLVLDGVAEGHPANRLTALVAASPDAVADSLRLAGAFFGCSIAVEHSTHGVQLAATSGPQLHALPLHGLRRLRLLRTR
jgi:hypothetical protein